MKRIYHIVPEGSRPELTDAEIARYRDPRKLLYNYQKAKFLLHRRPIYKDPKAFLVLLLIVLLTWLLTDPTVLRKEEQQAPTSVDRSP